MNLSKNFTLEEFVVSREAISRKIDNTPSEEIIKNLQLLATKLEEVRTLLGYPIHITSGYRCPDLNFVVRGSRNSQHMEGLAADFVCPQFGTPYDVCVKIAGSDLMFDQLIYEYGNWTHLGVGLANRKDLLTIFDAKKGYKRGIFTS